jgi:hypothetical protein
VKAAYMIILLDLLHTDLNTRTICCTRKNQCTSQIWRACCRTGQTSSTVPRCAPTLDLVVHSYSLLSRGVGYPSLTCDRLQNLVHAVAA